MLRENPIPAVPGFYWARWLTPWGEAQHEVPDPVRSRWEVVEVFVNSKEEAGADRLMALLIGVEKPEPLSHLIWGEGPLVEPGSNGAN